METEILHRPWLQYDFELGPPGAAESEQNAGLSVCQVFQTEVFPEFLKGNSKEEAGSFLHRPGGLRTAPVMSLNHKWNQDMK